MLNAVFRMNRFQSSGNPFVQNILQNLLQGVVRLAPVIERAADPGRRGIGGAQPCEPVSIFLSAVAAVNAVDQKQASLSTLPNGNVCFHWVRQLTMHSMHRIGKNRLLYFQSSLFFSIALLPAKPEATQRYFERNNALQASACYHLMQDAFHGVSPCFSPPQSGHAQPKEARSESIIQQGAAKCSAYAPAARV